MAGNPLSNFVIVLIGLGLPPAVTAVWLAFPIAIHKLGYFKQGS
jgi:hypothetical protein